MTDYNNPSEEFLRSIGMNTLLPQQPPFVMIDTLVHYSQKRVMSETLVRESNIYTENGILQSYALIENIAQTCAARIGYVNRYILKRGIRIGYIGSLKNLEIISLPVVGDMLSTQISIREELFGMILAEASVTTGGNVILRTELKIALKE